MLEGPDNDKIDNLLRNRDAMGLLEQLESRYCNDLL